MTRNFKEQIALIKTYLRTHWFAALLAGIFIVVLGVWYWTRGWGTPKPAPPPPPAEIQPTFGKLPPIEPKIVAITSPNLITYIGSPRITEPQTAMVVYPYSNTWMREPEVLAIAEELKLRTAPMRKGSLLTWTQGEEHLSADLEKGYFEYSVSFADEVEEWGNITLPDRGKLEEIMENRMENLLPSSLAGQLKLEDIRYYGISGNHLVPVDNPNNGQIAEGIFRRNLDNFEVYSDNPESGVAGLQVSPIRKTVRTRFSLKPLNMIQKGIYPLRTVEEAWQDLQAGKGFLVYLYDVKGKRELSDFLSYDLERVSISKASLAYYEVSEFGAYLQPIYVLRGTGTVKGGYPVEVVYYVQAVSGEWLQ